MSHTDRLRAVLVRRLQIAPLSGRGLPLSPLCIFVPYRIMPLPLGRGIKRCFCLTSDICLSDVCPSRTSGLSREQRDLPNLAQRGSSRHTWLGHHFQGQKIKGQGNQADLLTAALTREAGAAVTVITYWAWETTATLQLLGGARGAGEPTGGEEGRGISCRHAHSLLKIQTQPKKQSLLDCSSWTAQASFLYSPSRLSCHR